MALPGDLEIHLDRSPIERFEFTPDGFLRVHATIGRVGELVYVNADGSERSELVTPEVLMHRDSIDSFCQKPVTLHHPPGYVTPKNYRQYARGSTGQVATIEKGVLGLAAVVGDQEMIDEIVSGRITQVSAGYAAGTIKRDGKLYQSIRVGNHAAGLPEGRAGPDCNFPDVTFKMDGADGEEITITPWTLAEFIDPEKKAKYFDLSGREDSAEKPQPEVKSSAMKYELRHDGAVVETENKEVSDLFKSLKTRADSADAALAAATSKLGAAQSENGTLQAKLDASQASLKEAGAKLEQALDVAKRHDGAEIAARLETFVRAMPGAKEKGVELDFNMDSVAIKKAWVEAVHPEVRLDGKGASYAEAYFDVSAPQFSEVIKLDGAEAGEAEPISNAGSQGFQAFLESVGAARSRRQDGASDRQDGAEKSSSYRDKYRERIESGTN